MVKEQSVFTVFCRMSHKFTGKVLGGLLLILMVNLVFGCTLKPDQIQNIIVVATDHLGANDLDCQKETRPDLPSGIQNLCFESVRFTHAYTTHLRSVPALASILTGLTPPAHGLRGNQSFLENKLMTIPELLNSHGWKTGLFSGGPPVMRKNGLNQGFEIFEDNFRPNSLSLHRPLVQTIESFKEWFELERGKSHFAVIYVPDLNFEGHSFDVSKNSNSFTKENRYAEFDESLLTLITYLKKMKSWNNTTMILTGLSGTGSSSSTKFLELKSENTQVGLLIKPVMPKPKDTTMAWSHDQGVTLADLGVTILDLASIEKKEVDQYFEVLSLAPLLLSTTDKLPNVRWLYTETSVPWPGTEISIYPSARKGQFLAIKDSSINIYNSLIDRQELSPVRAEEGLTLGVIREASAIFEKSLGPYSLLQKRDRILIEQLAGWNPQLEMNLLTRFGHELSRKSAFGSQRESIQEFIAFELITRAMWKELEQFSELTERPDYSNFAKLLLSGFKKGTIIDPCIQYAVNLNDSDLKRSCDDSELTKWMERIAKYETEDKREARLAYSEFTIDSLSLKQHNLFGFNFDLTPQLITRLIRQELIFNLPIFQKNRISLQKESVQSKFD